MSDEEKNDVAVEDASADNDSSESAVAEHNYSDAELKEFEERIIDALKLVYDPEIPVNIYDLGLIYRVDVAKSGYVDVDMTLTAPGCPVAQTFPQTVRDAVCTVDGIVDATVEIVWDPPWTQEMMSEAARYQLNMF